MRQGKEGDEIALLTILGTIFGTGLEMKWEKDSRCTAIYGIECSGRKWVVKIPGRGSVWTLSQEQFLEQGDFINEATEAFLQRLRALGVPLPDPYTTMLVQGIPVHFMPDEGEDCYDILRRAPDRIEEILRGILEAIMGVLLGADRQVGLDARLSNFALPGGKVRCIDVFPPLLVFQGVTLVHYPNPTDPAEVAREVERKFTPFGMLRRLRFDLMAVRPEWGDTFIRLLREMGEPQLAQLVDGFKGLPDRQIVELAGTQRRILLDKLEPADADSRREIAARLLPTDGSRDRLMREVFAATSFVGSTEEERKRRLGSYSELISSFL